MSAAMKGFQQLAFAGTHTAKKTYERADQAANACENLRIEVSSGISWWGCWKTCVLDMIRTSVRRNPCRSVLWALLIWGLI